MCTREEQIKYDLNEDKELIDKVLKIVETFIIKRKLILYGGQAIDFSLKLRKSGIYKECDIPDYDFLSTNFIEDAYDLGEILEPFGAISVINAIHPSTMRVRVNFVVVADVSYCPQEIFKDLPVVYYKRMKALHPNFQRLDMHKSLCHPFENPPRENIFNRWEKDVARIEMFDTFYPLIPLNDKFDFKDNIIDLKYLSRPITGFLAYYLLLKSRKLESKLLDQLEVKFDSSLKTNFPVTLLMDDEDLFDEGFDKHESWFEKLPESWVLKTKDVDLEIYDIQRTSVSIDKIIYNKKEYVLANKEHILLYFLTKFYQTKNGAYWDFYVDLYKISIPLSVDMFESKKDEFFVEFNKRNTYNKIYSKRDSYLPKCYFPPKERPQVFDLDFYKLSGKKIQVSDL